MVAKCAALTAGRRSILSSKGFLRGSFGTNSAAGRLLNSICLVGTCPKSDCTLRVLLPRLKERIEIQWGTHARCFDGLTGSA
jgi:hypothetical protein